MKPNKDIDLKSEVIALSSMAEQLLLDVIPDGRRPVEIPIRRLQAISLLAEASQLLQSAVINLNYEHVVIETDGGS